VTQVQLPQQVGHYFPHFLPDDQHFLFLATGKSDASGVYVGDLNGSAPRRLMAADAAATIAGEYVYAVRQNKIVAQRFDWPRLEVTGDVSVVADNVLSDASGRSSALSASSTGIVAYRSGTPGRRQLVWVDRAGRLLSTVGGFEEAGVTPQTPEISPDGKYVAVTRSIDGSRDVWRWDLTRGISNPVTSAPGDDSQPVWSPDGTRIAFSSTRAGGASLYQRAADGTGSEDPLVVSADPKGTGGWSHDGRFFLFNVVSRTEGGIWALPLTGGEKPFNVVRDLSGTRQARFSPDSRWIAFEAEQSGRYEVWVQPFPGPGQRVRISTDGGVSIRWRRDGRELFYLGPDGTLNAVSFKTTAAGVADPSAPVPLFKPRIPGAAVIPGPGAGYYAVAPDGQRFLVSVLVAEPVTAPITILLNWRPPL
jgi:Tol biopolymer transport system component